MEGRLGKRSTGGNRISGRAVIRTSLPLMEDKKLKKNIIQVPLWFRIFIKFYLLTNSICLADHEHMVKDAEPIVVPLDFETKLECVMNIEPDKFQWKFYPAKDPYNPKAIIDLSESNFVYMPPSKFTVQRKQSDLTLQADSVDVAGDYQCLAYYGASVVVSVPWRITIATLGEFPKTARGNDTAPMVVNVTTTVGNTINWRCEPPLHSNPEPYIDYYQNGKYLTSSSSFNEFSTKSLILTNVSTNYTGRYSCRAINILTMKRENSNSHLNLNVVRSGPPQAPFFIVPPKKIYTAVKGDTVFLECSAVGNPVPHSIWEKKNGGEIPRNRAFMNNGGLLIRNITQSDEGVYTCTQKNTNGVLIEHITLIYNEEPSIDCLTNSTDVKQGENLDLDCLITGGIPEPQITWFLNGHTVLNDSAIEAIGNKIYFRPTEKRHAGNLQIFARNVVKTVYSSISIKVIPLSSSVDINSAQSLASSSFNDEDGNGNSNVINRNGGGGPPVKNHHRHNKSNPKKSPKHTKMVPPTKPSVSRLNDEAVVVRWSVPANKGLPIQFFKVQYRELGPIITGTNHGNANGSGNTPNNSNKGSRWRTTNADIPPHIGSYEVNNLKPDHVYKFRIAAVYSNNDNKLSQNSDKFLLRRMDFDIRNPLPVPIITHTETMNSTAVKIYWKYVPSNNITIDGFFINYISASSAADYMKATVDGEFVDSYVLSHLQPDTIYDIKLQSFTTKSASAFSAIMKAKTSPADPLVSLTTSLTSSSTASSNGNDNAVDGTLATGGKTSTSSTNQSENGVISKLYVMIAVGVLGAGALIICGVVLLLFCRKWKQKKNNNRDSGNDKAPSSRVDVDHQHHIHHHHHHLHQVDGGNNEYVGSKAASVGSRSNGCVLPGNRMTITSNPLADAADNKNNNCSAPSSSSQASVCAGGSGAGDGGGSGPGAASNVSEEVLKKSRNERTTQPIPSAPILITKSRENYV